MAKELLKRLVLPCNLVPSDSLTVTCDDSGCLGIETSYEFEGVFLTRDSVKKLIEKCQEFLALDSDDHSEK